MLKKLVILFSAVILSLSSYAQICEGNLGENIFTDGDFGSGSANILTPNPQIAPGYNYDTTPPPNDGSYCITNNTSTWGDFAGPFWIDIQDNSPDPNGYMMVVNAGFSPGLFYEQTVDGLCENTLYVFSADIINLLNSAAGDGSPPNVSFLLDGVVQFETGDVPRNFEWNTYGFTFTTAPGQTSLTLSLRNNAPGGNGNDLGLDNITFRACGPEALILPTQIANICEDGDPINLDATINGDQYPTPAVQWQQSLDEGQTWSDIPGATDLSFPFTNLSAGLYYYRYLLANGEGNLSNPFCRVVSNMKIVNVVPKFYTIVDTLCTGLSFELKDSLYSETGVYTDSLLTWLGCDSIVTLDLTIVPDPDITGEFTLVDPTCQENSDGSITLDAILNGAPPYTISINGQNSANGNVINASDEAYLYEIIDRYGCSADSSVQLQSADAFIVELGDDQSIDLGDNVELSPFFSEPFSDFLLTLNGEVFCEEDCDEIDFIPTNSGTMTLSATSLTNNCFASDSIEIEVRKVRKVFFPNAFSPNEDGVNDRFLAFGSVPNIQSIKNLSVFDRWGNLVFEQTDALPNDLSQGWDGLKNGEVLPDGVYVWFAEIEFLDGASVLYEGDVTLMK